MAKAEDSDEVINVEVAYALPHQHELVKLVLPSGATVQEAIESSGLLQRYPDIDLNERNKVGIFAKLAKLDTELRDRDRVEIYRPLIADPKAVRKKRAAAGQRGDTAKKAGDSDAANAGKASNGGAADAEAENQGGAAEESGETNTPEK